MNRCQLIHYLSPRVAFLIFIVCIPRITLSAPLQTDQGGMIVLDENSDAYPLGRHLMILEDPGSSMTIQQAASPEMSEKYIRSNTDSPSYGFNNLDYWVKFHIKNERGRFETWILELDYPHMDNIEVYYKNAKGAYIKKIGGDVRPFNNREIVNRNPAFSLSIKKNQERTFYLHFSGECSKQFPLTLWSVNGFIGRVSLDQYVLGIYYGIILVMMLYNLFLFFFVRDKSYLYYFIYIGSYGLVQMAYNGLAYQYLWPSSPEWHNISLPFLIGWAILWMAIFSQSFLHTREHTAAMHGLMRALMGIGIAVMIYSIFGNYLIAINAAMLLMVMASFVIMSSAFVCMRRGYRPARFFIIAWGVFLFGLLLIALNKLHILPVMFITEYANQVGSAIEVTLLSVALADRINIIEQEKKRAQLATIQAQEKYKMLVEGSNDLIFSLDDKWNFITVNNAVMTQLRLSQDAVISGNFLDLIYNEEDVGDVSKKLVHQKLEEFISTKEPISFKVMFKSPIAAEPKEMQVRLEHINIEGMNEVLGKAVSMEEDRLVKCFEEESQKYSISNHLTTADDITQRITRNLAKYLDQKQITLARIALREIIINAIEHGNLNISYTEKTNAIMSDTYFQFIAERRQDQRYRERHVRIEHRIDSKKVVYRIIDEGQGFEHAKVLGDNARDANDNFLPHGRGVTLAKNIFDEVVYNEKGNEVTLVMRFSARA